MRVIDKMKIKLKDKFGGTYLEAALVIVAIMWIIAILVGLLPVFTYINRVNTYTTNTARIISVEGGLTPEAVSKIREYGANMKLEEVTMNYSKSQFFDGYKIQLNDEVVVEAATAYEINILRIPVRIPINSRAYARSEVYYKN